MIPILYQPSAETFDGRGVGRLADAISLEVSYEINGEHEMTMTYPMDGILYGDIVLGSIIAVQPGPGKDPQPFEVYDISRPINGIVTVYGQHIRYRLAMIPVSPFTANSLAEALAGLKANAVEECPFDFWTDKTVNSKYTQTVPGSMGERIQGEQGSILQTYRGQLEYDNWTVKLWNRLGEDKGVTISYGKNLMSLTQEENIRETVTGIYPYWTGFDGEAEEYRELPEKVLYAANADAYPYKRTIPLDLSTDWPEDPPTEEQLRARAERYIRDNNLGVPEVSLKVSFVNLADTEDYKDIAPLETVNLGDTVRVVFERLGVNGEAQVKRTRYDALMERYNSIELGTIKKDIASVIVGTEEATKTVAIQASNALAGFNKSLDQKSVFDRLTNNGTVQGLYLEDGQLYINASYLKTGTLDANDVHIVNLTADHVESYTADESTRVQIDGGVLSYQKKSDGDTYEPIAQFGTETVEGAQTSYSGALNLYNRNEDGSANKRAVMLPDVFLTGMDPSAVMMDGKSATGEIGSGTVYANWIAVLGPGKATPDGTFAIGYKNAAGNVVRELGFAPIQVPINGTTYTLLGKVGA